MEFWNSEFITIKRKSLCIGYKLETASWIVIIYKVRNFFKYLLVRWWEEEMLTKPRNQRHQIRAVNRVVEFQADCPCLGQLAFIVHFPIVSQKYYVLSWEKSSPTRNIHLSKQNITSWSVLSLYRIDRRLEKLYVNFEIL